jgi:hypothetical protein
MFDFHPNNVSPSLSEGELYAVAVKYGLTWQDLPIFWGLFYLTFADLELFIIVIGGTGFREKEILF